MFVNPSRSKEIHATIFADGEPCSAALSARLRRDRFCIALDGAAEAIRRQRWLPDLVLGDFDSASTATLRHFSRRGVPLIETPDQNFTDLEKALLWCKAGQFKSVWITQALGGRLDHSFTNLSLLRRFHVPGRELLLFRDRERVRFVRDEKVRFTGSKERGVAVLPFAECRAWSRGLAFELNGLKLELGVQESTSNRARGSVVDLRIEGDALLVEQLP
jgi:thiamine pyrophosphokinase